MKVTKTVEVDICDVCHQNEANSYSNCHTCGKSFCYQCSETSRVEYRHSMYCSGSGDLFLCLACESALLAKPTELFLPYLKLKRLKREMEAYNTRVESERRELEADIERLYELHRADQKQRGIER